MVLENGFHIGLWRNLLRQGGDHLGDMGYVERLVLSWDVQGNEKINSSYRFPNLSVKMVFR